MKTIVFCGGGSVARARERHEHGAQVLAWNDEAARALATGGVPARRAELPSAERDAVDEAAIDWTKAWGRRPLVDGASFRDLLRWEGVSLWWFAELYLHHSSAAARHVRLVETFHRLLAQEGGDEVEALGLGEDEEVLLGRACTARAVLFHGRRAPSALRLRLRTLQRSLESHWNTAKTCLSALKAARAGAPPTPPPGRSTVLFLSHAAFWRERRDPATGEPHAYEHYFDRLIPETAAHPELQAWVVAVGPQAAFRRRGRVERVREWLRPHGGAAAYVHVNRYTTWEVFRRTWTATREIRAAWRRLRRSPAVHEAFSHRGVSFADLGAPELAGTLLLQLPWAVRSYEEMLGVVRSVRPAALALYAESSGWGRAALAAARASGVPSVAIQHGILYPRYYSYRHEADEGDCPRPERTAVFGEAARRLLVEQGRYAPESLVLTGSPKFDDLLAASRSWDRESIRRRLGVLEGERLVLVASRHQGIRETHASMGSAFPGFLRAVEALPGVRCLVKPHPAEPATHYEDDIRAAGCARTRVLPARSDLFELLHAADVLVTVESLSAVEALVLGCPVLVLNMPTNIREMVEAGAALGVKAGQDCAGALHDVLFDSSTRDALERARREYLADVALGVDGGASRRIVDLLRATARGPAAEEPASAAGVVGF